MYLRRGIRVRVKGVAGSDAIVAQELRKSFSERGAKQKGQLHPRVAQSVPTRLAASASVPVDRQRRKYVALQHLRRQEAIRVLTPKASVQ